MNSVPVITSRISQPERGLRTMLNDYMVARQRTEQAMFFRMTLVNASMYKYYKKSTFIGPALLIRQPTHAKPNKLPNLRSGRVVYYLIHWFPGA